MYFTFQLYFRKTTQFFPPVCLLYSSYKILCFEHSGHQMCGFFPLTPSDLLWHQLVSYSLIYRLRTQSHKTSPTLLQMPITSSRSPGCPQLLSDLAANGVFPRPSCQVWLICYSASQNSGKQLGFTSLLQDVTKNADEERDK